MRLILALVRTVEKRYFHLCSGMGQKASSGLNARFFRVRNGFGKPLDCISPFCEEAVQADAAAFSQLMQHLAQQTLNMSSSRFRWKMRWAFSALTGIFRLRLNRLSTARFTELVAQQYGKGSWEEVFGRDGGEMMMAWQYASAVEKIAACGKAV